MRERGRKDGQGREGKAVIRARLLSVPGIQTQAQEVMRLPCILAFSFHSHFCALISIWVL